MGLKAEDIQGVAANSDEVSVELVVCDCELAGEGLRDGGGVLNSGVVEESIRFVRGT